MSKFYNQPLFVLVCGLLLVGLAQPVYLPAYDERLAVWIRLDDLAAGLKSLEENKDCISRVLVSDHSIARDGVHLDFRVADGPRLAAQAVAWCKREQVPVMMGLGNYQSGFGHPAIITGMLNSTSQQQQHIREIVTAVQTYGYDGVDLDYENLPPHVRTPLTGFVKQLAQALHGLDKKLDITVPPKFSSPGWKMTQAYDWQQLPTMVDRFNVMCYDWFVRTGPPGPIIPLGVTKKVVQFARRCPHPEKIWIGHPAYGNHWIKSGKKWRGTYQGAQTWQTLAEKKQLAINYAAKPVGGFEVGAFAHFFYHDHQGAHQIWYGDHRSLAATREVVKAADLGGLFIWRAGFEDKQLWITIRDHLE